MATILIHIVTGPENPTRAALGLLVGRAAVDAGHDVRVFLGGDGVQFARSETAEASHGVGTGSVSEHLDALAAAGVPLYFSGMSSKARGVTADTRPGVELITPPQLVELATTSDTVLSY